MSAVDIKTRPLSEEQRRSERCLAMKGVEDEKIVLTSEVGTEQCASTAGRQTEDTLAEHHVSEARDGILKLASAIVREKGGQLEIEYGGHRRIFLSIEQSLRAGYPFIAQRESSGTDRPKN